MVTDVNEMLSRSWEAEMVSTMSTPRGERREPCKRGSSSSCGMVEEPEPKAEPEAEGLVSSFVVVVVALVGGYAGASSYSSC
jgi:hypothetical protein